jgi:hypothetical protein
LVERTSKDFSGSDIQTARSQQPKAGSLISYHTMTVITKYCTLSASQKIADELSVLQKKISPISADRAKPTKQTTQQPIV